MQNGSSKSGWCVTAILVAAALLRLLLLADHTNNSPLSRLPLVDAAIHHESAIQITKEGLFLDAPFQRPPGYAYFLAAIYALFGASPVAAAAIQMAIGLLGLLLLYRIALQYTLKGPACLSVAMAASYGPLAFFELKLLPASLSVFLTLLFLYLVFVHSKKGKTIWIFLAGIAAGLLLLDRPNLVFIPALLALCLFIQRRPPAKAKAILLSCGVLAGISPAWIHNYMAGDGSALICGGGGVNFYLGNRQGAEPSFTGDFEGTVDPAKMPETSARLFLEEQGHLHRDQAELERFWIEKGFKEIISDPVSWGFSLLRKARALLSGFEYGVNYSFAAEKERLKTVHLFLLPFSVLLCLGVAGAFIRDRQGKVFLLVVLAGVALSSLIFFTYSRFRITAIPVLAVFAADAVYHSLAALKGRRIKDLLRLFIPAAAASIFAFLPPDDVALKQTSAGHALLGAAFFREREIDNAVHAYERAIAIDSSSTKAYQTLAGILELRGDTARARQLHLLAIEHGSHDPGVLDSAALFFLNASKPYKNIDRAEELILEAMNLDPESAMTYLCLGMLRCIQGRESESDGAISKALSLSGRAPWMMKQLAEWYRGQGLPQKAAQLEGKLLQRKR
ncbi:MAG: glycosyltransferase family 39 protein [Planctomycetota bacterium]